MADWTDAPAADGDYLDKGPFVVEVGFWDDYAVWMDEDVWRDDPLWADAA